jgi:ceramide glucosyltransferase
MTAFSVEIALAVWTLAAGTWWILAGRLIAKANQPRAEAPASRSADSLTIFKPLPPLRKNAPDPRMIHAIESFLRQLDGPTTLLLGLHRRDRTAWEPVIGRWQKEFPAGWRLIERDQADVHANPKIAWQEILASHADGQWWLWSDADIVAPPDFISNLRGDMGAGPQNFWTYSYVVTAVDRPPGGLDALFANVEFFPGVLLLGGKPINFALGAGILFKAEDFRERIRWTEIGAWLSDDHFLGHRLAPGKLGRSRLETFSDFERWRPALLHYLRWQKTVRWCNPGGFAGQLLILPLIGWASFTACDFLNPAAIAGLAATWLMEMGAGYFLCRAAGCRLRGLQLGALPFWPWIRTLGWLACWLPWPVVWSGSVWWSLKKSNP